MSNSFEQKNDEAVISSSIVNACLTGDTSGALKNDLDVSYGNVRIPRMASYGQEHVEGQQVMSLDAHPWGDTEGLQQPDLSETVYSNPDAMMKHYANPSTSGNLTLPSRMMTDRERLQLHNQLSWEEASKQDVIIVRCRDMTAELHRGRLGSGSKGKCIKMGDSWMTPSEFESVAGRGSSKDWKRSVRFGGHTLQKLIEEGILAPHAISCTCSICCGEGHLVNTQVCLTPQTGGPVRLFTPYKRKRKDGNYSDSHQGKVDQMISGGVPAYSQIEEIVNAMVAASQQLKIMLDQLRLQYETYREASINQTRIQLEIEKREALAHQRSEIVSILRRELNMDQEVILNQIMSQIPSETQHTKVCASCGRDAFLECTACRRACYCSAYCQQRDWPQHQHQCSLIQNTESMVASSAIQAQVDDTNDHSQVARDDNNNES